MRRLTKHKAIVATAAVFIASVATGCFTGIESTPKVTADEVRRQTSSPTAEQMFLSDVTPEKVGDWKRGKRFYVTDPKISLVMKVSPAGAMLTSGDTLLFEAATDAVSIMGQPQAELTFSASGGRMATYRADQGLATLESLDGIKIPFTVEESIVKEIDRKLKGNEYWITTSDWLDRRLEPRRGRKFIKVKVTGVDVGNETFPARVTLVDEKHQPADTFAMLLSIGDGIASSRKFGSVFSFSDPHKRYPTIAADVWTMICNGQVRDGMTREEVRLSIGRPLNIDRRPGYSTLQEIWTYENGRYLLFEDGLLKMRR